ncbi:MAG: homocysteine S-methyltransferase [Chthonomonadaceae bacterium]|nr:homocysteine S-methyltransferase [Chthonomonadaceae bacterium]
MLADGAVGSELIKTGIAPERTVEANVSHVHRVRDIHRRAIAAGAELLTTNTFGTPSGEGWAAEFHAGVELAAAAVAEAGREIAVLLSVYPEELRSNPAVVLAPFREPETQGWLLLIETAVDLRAAVEAIDLARSHGVTTIAATCHFQADARMPDGTLPAQAAAALQQAGASIVGANCGTGPEEMVDIAAQMRAVTDLPLLFQPNAGLPQWDEDANDWVYSIGPDRFAAAASALFDIGVAIVGGCCGTTPAHIAAVHRLLFHPQRRE